MTIETLTIYAFGREVLSLSWRSRSENRTGPAADDDRSQLAERDADEPEGISYSCGHCGEVLVCGLRHPLTPRDEFDLLAAHECDPSSNPEQQSAARR